MFDIYFDLHQNKFLAWKGVFTYTTEAKLFSQEKRSKNLMKVNVATQDVLKMTYLLDRLLQAGKSTLILGPSGHGKSTIMR